MKEVENDWLWKMIEWNDTNTSITRSRYGSMNDEEKRAVSFCSNNKIIWNISQLEKGTFMWVIIEENINMTSLGIIKIVWIK